MSRPPVCFLHSTTCSHLWAFAHMTIQPKHPPPVPPPPKPSPVYILPFLKTRLRLTLHSLPYKPFFENSRPCSRSLSPNLQNLLGAETYTSKSKSHAWCLTVSWVSILPPCSSERRRNQHMFPWGPLWCPASLAASGLHQPVLARAGAELCPRDWL